MDNEYKLTIFIILKIVRFYSMKQNKGLKSTKIGNSLYN